MCLLLLIVSLHITLAAAQLCPPDGDVNQDGNLTPADALLAFQQFLALIELDACQQDHANVLDPTGSAITPADALCIFRRFLGLPSCLMTLTSSAYSEGSPIPVQYTCDGANLSPPLNWADLPEAAQSLSLIADDPDAPDGTFVHWVIYDIPATETGLAEGLPNQGTLSNGARQGQNSFGNIGYDGPCPPPGDAPHRYFFKLSALDTVLNLVPGASKAEIENAMTGHILGETRLIGTYDRQ